jgi:hypothetical protein
MSPSISPSLSPSASISPSFAYTGTTKYFKDTDLAEVMQALNVKNKTPDNIIGFFYDVANSKYVVIFT